MSTERSGSERVVLLPSGEIGQALLALSSDWLKSGIINSIHWLYPDQIGDTSDGDRLVKSLHSWIDPETGTPTLEERDLFQWIALRNPAEVTLASVRFVSEESGSAARVNALYDSFIQLFRSKLPQDALIQGREVKGIKQRTLNLIFSSSKDERNTNVRSISSRYFEENVFIAQEDRENPAGVDAWKPLHDKEAFASYVMSNLVSMIGGWTGVGNNILPELPYGISATNDYAPIRVARSFVRIVQTETFTLQTAANVAEELVGRKSPLLDPFLAAQVPNIELISDEKTERVLDAELTWITQQDNGALMYRGPQALQLTPPPRIGIFSLQSEFWKFSFDKIKILPVLMWRSVISTFSQRQKELYLGSDSDIEVDGRIDLRIRTEDPKLADALDSLRGLQDQAKKVVNQRPLEVTRISAPNLWNKMRDGLIALVDGSAGPSGGRIIKSEEGKVQLLSDINRLIPRPGDSWTFSSDDLDPAKSTPIKRSDVEETAAHMGSITEKLSDIAKSEQLLEDTKKVEKSRAEQLRNDFDQLIVRRDALASSKSFTSDDATKSDIEEVSQSIDSLTRELELSKSRLEAIDRRLSTFASDKSRLEAEKTSLDSWIRDEQDALSARLMRHLEDQEMALAMDEQRLSESVEALNTNHLSRAGILQSKFLKSLRNIIFFTTLFVVVYYFLIRQIRKTQDFLPFLSTSPVFLIGLWIFIFLIALISILRTYFRNWMKLRRFVDRGLEQVKWVLSSANHIRQERARIDGLFPQVRGQLELMGYLIHHPWKVPPHLRAQQSITPEIAHLPNHLQIAVVGEEGAREGATVRRQLLANSIKPGMRRESIQELLTDIERHLTLPNNSLNWDVIDGDASPTGPRSFVVKALSSTNLVERAGVKKVRQFVREIQGYMGSAVQLPSVIQLQKVGVGGGAVRSVFDSQSEGVDWDNFLVQAIIDANQLAPSTFTDQARLEYHPDTNFKSVASVPARIARRAGGAVEIVQSEAEHGYSLEVACRIDITDPLPPEALAAFAHQETGTTHEQLAESVRVEYSESSESDTDFKI